MEKNNQTITNFEKIFDHCINIVEDKVKKYGYSWRIFGMDSLTDQIYIKAKRLKSIQDKPETSVDETMRETLFSLINYSIFHHVQRKLGPTTTPEENNEENFKHFREIFKEISDTSLELMTDKNDDYGEAWKEMRISSLLDMVLVKLYRIKQMEVKFLSSEHENNESIIEEVDSNFYDIINYSVFILLKL
jgi:hypothetical protein